MAALAVGAVGVFAIAQPLGGGGEPAPAVRATLAPTESPAPPVTQQSTATPQASPTSAAPAEGSDALVVYEKDGDVFVIRADGSDNRKLFSAEIWSLSRDGLRLAYVEPGDPGDPFTDLTSPKLQIVSIDGGATQTVLQHELLVDVDAIGWSRDGGFIEMWSLGPDPAAPDHKRRYQAVRLPTMEEVGEVTVEWAWDGRQMGQLKLGPESISNAFRPLGFAANDRFAYAVCERLHGEWCSAVTIHLRDFSSNIETLSRTFDLPPPDESLGQVIELDMSPDGNWVLNWVLVPRSSSTYTGQLAAAALVSVDSAEVKPITTATGPSVTSLGFGVFLGEFAWSRDAKRLAFWEGTDLVGYTLYAVDISSNGAPIALTRPSTRGPIIWSESGERVYFGQRAAALFAANADGSGGHEVGPREVRFCKTPTGHAIALETAAHPGVVRVVAEDTDCQVSADFSFALEALSDIQKRLFAVDLSTGERALLADAGGPAAWAGPCATGRCPASLPVPSPTPTPTITIIPPGTPEPFLEYTIVEGDTWYAIAQAFGVDVESLAAYNGLTLDDSLQPGEVILIPGSDY